VFIAVSLQRSYCLLFTNFSRHAIYTVSQNRTQTIATEILSSRPTFNSCIHNATALCTSTSNVQTAKFMLIICLHFTCLFIFNYHIVKKGSPYSITERRVPQLIPVLGSQPAGDVNHKPDGRLPLLSAMPAVTPATLNRAANNFAAW